MNLDYSLLAHQLKPAHSYTEEHITDNELYKLFVHKENDNIIRVQIQLCQKSSKLYSLWIEYSDGPIPI